MEHRFGSQDRDDDRGTLAVRRVSLIMFTGGNLWLTVG